MVFAEEMDISCVLFIYLYLYTSDDWITKFNYNRQNISGRCVCDAHKHSALTYPHDSATGIACEARTVCSEIRNYVKIKNREQKNEQKKRKRKRSEKASDRQNRTVRLSIPIVIYQILSIAFCVCECVRISLCTERGECLFLLSVFFRCVFTNGDTGRITFNYNNAWIRSICATSILYRLNSCALHRMERENTVK